jgi:hypothetical protein
VFALLSATAVQARAQTTITLTAGWNLLGNGSSTALDVKTIFGDQFNVSTVWKWVPAKSGWGFYAPLLSEQALTDYAASKSYDVLASVKGGEGFWVNAKIPFTVQLPVGAAITSVSFLNTASGWNLIAIGDNNTPSQFNTLMSTTGIVPVNLTTLWAWDATKSNWYFYAPNLETTGALASYIASKSYLDFGSKTLDPFMGFWVNIPASAGGSAVPYVEGSLLGQDTFYLQLSDSFAATSGAVLQAILSVNSLLFTDQATTSLDTFSLRKNMADQALSVLDNKAKATEALIDAAPVASSTLLSTYSPDQVLATVASGPANQQLKTLMKTYQVSAVGAKNILDNAMAGLSSQYKQEAAFYDTAARTATLVKEGAGLAFTTVGAVATAGGATGALPLADAVVTLITGSDGIVKVTKAGYELVKGADLQLPQGKVKALVTVLSDTSEIISFTDLRKWGAASEKLTNVIYLTGKLNDAMQDGVLNLGDHAFDLKPIAKPLPASISSQLVAASGSVPSTMPGTYKIAGNSVTVAKLPASVMDVINMLPQVDRVATLTPPVRITLKLQGGVTHYLNYVGKTNTTATKRIMAYPSGCGGVADRIGDEASGNHEPVYSYPLQGKWGATFSSDSSSILQLNCDVSSTGTDGSVYRYTFVLADLPFKEIYAQGAWGVTRRYQAVTGGCAHVSSMSIVYPPPAQWAADYTFKSQECMADPQVDVTEYLLPPFPEITP